MSFFARFSSKQAEAQPEAPDGALAQGLEKTTEGLLKRLSRAVIGKSKVDDEVLDNLEEALILSDVGVETTLRVVEMVQKRVARDKVLNAAELNQILREEIERLLENNESAAAASPDVQGNPYVVMVVGVNGAGKTTTIGKLAARLAAEGKKVYIGAADTFRAAAVGQLEVWAARAGATIVKQQMGADPASVAFDALSSAKANGADAVLIDTAGRLHNKVNLMNELSKIRNVMRKVIPSAPHEVLLVLDGSTGQNAYRQAVEFSKATEVTALAVTKLDGTAKGGVVIGISDQLKVPVKYIGVGEKVDDLQPFDKKKFVETLFKS
ncbi:MAG: signal recognition particle-docking protein FtsY [Prevotellaceae bacterium]|jgi:fused signal recognition particle receptor|nr:signal recognition particle-docking protein FtsY [Prevotellaceae bacterium]